MTLDVFDIKLGNEKMPPLDPETTGFVAVKMLDAVQTVVDVLTDNDGHGGWTVTFDSNGQHLHRSFRKKRQIVVCVKPLFDARPGDSARWGGSRDDWTCQSTRLATPSSTSSRCHR